MNRIDKITCVVLIAIVIGGSLGYYVTLGPTVVVYRYPVPTTAFYALNATITCFQISQYGPCSEDYSATSSPFVFSFYLSGNLTALREGNGNTTVCNSIDCSTEDQTALAAPKGEYTVYPNGTVIGHTFAIDTYTQGCFYNTRWDTGPIIAQWINASRTLHSKVVQMQCPGTQQAEGPPAS